MQELFYDIKECAQQIYKTIKFDMHDSFYEYMGQGVGGDLSSKIDLFAEQIFIDRLQKYGKIISEEAGEVGEGKDLLIIDPIDGSDNLLSSFPYYGSSVAMQRDGKTLFSFIVNYANGDFYVKWEDFFKKGSLLHDNLKDIRTNYFAKIGLFEKAYANPKIVKKLKQNSYKFRSPGAVALSLAYAHYVKFVIFIGKIRAYDVEAGLHQCEDLFIYNDDTTIIVAKEREVFAKLLEIVGKG
ncbi:inositol monophosphatase family protein [Nitratiruptor sp. YY09-18]|uniref:inositol monophosphatase family protein n=1 Tax=Nitratiruptor sp. YY09-18 TaxID=2724901 RepID=UPI0019169F15|nr:inositol monophosphatase family protein [Nitratiruptor sp. YY09-18]BCD67801.1 myo-inositol-1(or 4)-monophosphatase [Nitratiruptor sp. YY09-18]